MGPHDSLSLLRGDKEVISKSVSQNWRGTPVRPQMSFKGDREHCLEGSVLRMPIALAMGKSEELRIAATSLAMSTLSFPRQISEAILVASSRNALCDFKSLTFATL